jgi:hypothetical protein
VGANENGVTRVCPAPNGGAPAAASGGRKTVRRRLVLLAAGEDSESERVLAEYTGGEGRGKDVHADIERLAAQHPGKCLAAEWLGRLGWTRFLWCRKGG